MPQLIEKNINCGTIFIKLSLNPYDDYFSEKFPSLGVLNFSFWRTFVQDIVFFFLKREIFCNG